MATPENHTDWAWLADTYWYVPPPDLPALQLDRDATTLSWQVDQTVWHITGCKDGYLWGVTSVVLQAVGKAMPAHGPGSRPTHFTLLGTITPKSQVQLTFVPGKGPGSATTGLGQMVQLGGGWGFEMQMSTERIGSRVLHWATMVQTIPGEPSWDQLPGLTLSVPQMLEGATYPSLDEREPTSPDGT